MSRNDTTTPTDPYSTLSNNLEYTLQCHLTIIEDGVQLNVTIIGGGSRGAMAPLKYQDSP